VLLVHGTIADVDGRTIARIDPFQCPHPPRAGAPMELYIGAFPTEEFDAVVSHVAPNDAFTVRAEADLVRADPRLVPGTAFAAQIVVTRIEAVVMPGNDRPSDAPYSINRVPGGSIRPALLSE
jgi:hypothetical protein